MEFIAVYYDPRFGDTDEAYVNAESPEAALREARSRWVHLDMLLNQKREVIWERNPLILFKWICDGAESLEEISDRLRSEAEQIDKKRGEGFRLSYPVSDGVAMLGRPD